MQFEFLFPLNINGLLFFCINMYRNVYILIIYNIDIEIKNCFFLGRFNETFVG